MYYLDAQHGTGKCVMIVDSDVRSVPELCSNHEEADNRIMMHISHGSIYNINSILVYSTDTDVLISLIYHYKMSFQIEELFLIIGGSRRTRKTVPLHKLDKSLNPL